MLVKAFFKEFLVEKKAWLTVKSSGGTENSLSPPTARCSTNEKKKSTRQIPKT